MNCLSLGKLKIFRLVQLIGAPNIILFDVVLFFLQSMQLMQLNECEYPW